MKNTLVDCKTHGNTHANCACPDRDPVECARETLLLVLPENEVDAWFQKPNKQLEGLTPQQVINAGLAGIVRDLTWDMITGSPS